MSEHARQNEQSSLGRLDQSALHDVLGSGEGDLFVQVCFLVYQRPITHR